jgi:hypothetical protein
MNLPIDLRLSLEADSKKSHEATEKDYKAMQMPNSSRCSSRRGSADESKRIRENETHEVAQNSARRIISEAVQSVCLSARDRGEKDA